MRWVLCAAAALLVTSIAVSSAEPPAAPERLSETGLYVRGQVGIVAPHNRAFSPQYPLWTDGATKSRWVYLPKGARIDASDLSAWDVPVGTKFWKEFQFGGRKIETRLIWRASRTEWVFAAYAWTDDGADAVLAPPQGVRGVAEVAPGKRHSIPSITDCTACHGTSRPGPLGFTALQLSPDRDPNAIHGEPLRADMLTLDTLIREGRLAHSPASAYTPPPRIASNNPRTRAVLGYLMGNCGGCHNGRGEIAALGPVLRPEELARNADSVAASLVGQRTRWQLPGTTDGSVLVDVHAPDQSALLARLRSRSPSSQMPPLGTVVRDSKAVQLVAEWISRDLATAARSTRR